MADTGARDTMDSGAAVVAAVGEFGFEGVEELGFEGEPFLLPVPSAPPAGPAAPAPQASPRDLGDLSHLARDIADRVGRAHAAVLEAHEAVQRHLLARCAPGARPPAVPAPRPVDRPGRVELVRTVPADSAYSVAGQADPAWILDTAAAALPLLGERGLASAGAVYRPGRTVLTWHRELPEAGAEVRVRAGAEAVHRDERGTRFRFDWQVHVEGNLLVEATGTGGFRSPEHAAEPLPGGEPWPERQVPRHPRQFRPLAVTRRSRLTWQELRALAGGFLAQVLGPGFEGEGTGPRLPGPAPRLIGSVAEATCEGGRYGQGTVTAELTFHGGGPARGADATALLAEAVSGVLQVYALRCGLHLCLPDARFQPWDGGPAAIEVIDPTALGAALRCEVDVAEVGLVPRPHVVADAVVLAGDRPVARLHGIGVALYEPPGADLGALTIWEARDSPAAHGSLRQRGALQRMLLAHSAEGDLSAVTGKPQVTPASSVTVRPRLPRGDLLMVDRALDYDAEPLDFRPGATLTSEYGVHPDPWFCRENGSGAVPNLLYMESSLQAAAQLSAVQGILHQHRDSTFVCRNLEGRATLLRHTDPRGLALRHRTTLADHSKLPGAILHRYTYELSLPDGPVYSGESVHGFLTKEVLDNQQGLDGGQYVPPWLDRLPARPPGLRRLDLSRDTRLGRGRFALLSEADLVPDGGAHGAGYLLWERAVPEDDWFMAHHFRFDPVMPGSVGVEALFQSVAAYALHTGLADSLPDPAARPAAHVELAWKYRGQITPGHRRMRGEVHIRRVRRRGDGLLLVADGSVWRDDLRIYQVDNIGVEILPTGGTTDGKVPR